MKKKSSKTKLTLNKRIISNLDAATIKGGRNTLPTTLHSGVTCTVVCTLNQGEG